MEICQSIFYLFALVESQATVDTIWNIATTKRFLQHARLSIGAIQHRKIAVCITGHGPTAHYARRNHARFVVIAVCLRHFYLVAHTVFREYIFAYLFFIVGYQTIGRIYYILRRTIILLQFECLQGGEGAFQIQDITNICTTEGVNTLSIITYHTQIADAATQLHHYHILCKIGVLIFIDQDVAEVLTIMR